MRVAGVAAGTSPLVGTVLIAGSIAAFWGVAVALGGAGAVPPHWFYIPITFAALRFGPRATGFVSAVCGVVAGPLLPLDVRTGAAQGFSDWGMRLVFFVAIGQILALLVHQPLALRLTALRHARAARSLRRALANGELEVDYQPIFDILSNPPRIAGAEALVRWRHAERGRVMPDEFIPMAEATGLVADVDDFVLHDACSRVRRWRELVEDPQFTVSINLSPCELADENLLSRVAAAIETHGIDPQWLTLEVTETAVMEDVELCLKQLHALRALGVNLAIDDFGTGQSSLSHIHVLPVQTIKLDSSFIAQITDPARGRGFVGTLVLLTQSLDLPAVAEGIEHRDQLDLLRAMRCEFGQGFHLAVPSSPAHLTRALAEAPSVVRTEPTAGPDQLTLPLARR